jgi:predicted nucleotidyltransferase
VPHAVEGKLGAALAALSKALNATGIAWMCIGGIAVIAQGVRRTTTDIDVTLRAEGVDLEALVRRLARHKIRPRIDHAVTFARRTQVLLLEHAPSGVELDVSLAWLSFEHEALAAPVTIDFAGIKAPAARPEDLVIYKLFAARPQDLKDAEALLLMHRSAIDLARVRVVLDHLGEMSDDPGISRRLDEIDRRNPKPLIKPGARRRPGGPQKR